MEITRNSQVLELTKESLGICSKCMELQGITANTKRGPKYYELHKCGRTHSEYSELSGGLPIDTVTIRHT